ncbi:MAG: LexA family transcriptional regulator [Candidatus Riflebacteria bacterium]|nr:LexA family transcriptional regulator [Candidatus Riflebacteria bacterium]
MTKLTDSKKPSQFALGLGSRLSKLAEKVGGKASLAKKAKTSLTNIYRYISGKRLIPAELLANIARVCNVSMDWLAYGEDDCQSTINQMDNFLVQEEKKEYSTKKHLFHLSRIKSCFLSFSEVIAKLGLSRSELMSQFKGKVGDFFFVQVSDEGMDPTLKCGDIVLIDSRTNEIIFDGLYFIAIGEVPLLKRIQRLPSNVIEVISDNKNYRAYTLNLGQEPEKISIIGQVVWQWRGQRCF